MSQSRSSRNSKSPSDLDTLANPDNCDDGLSRTSITRVAPLGSNSSSKNSRADFLVKPIV